MSKIKWKRTFTWENSKYLVYFLLGMIGLFTLDIASKWIVESLLVEGQKVEVIPNFFYFTKSYNTGMAFSFGASLPMAVGRSINIIISLVMSVGILAYWILNDEEFNHFQRTIAMLLSAGAIGNLIDRAFYWEAITGFDGVIDFLQFYLGGGPSSPANMFNPFATFNLADSYLVIGILLFIGYLIYDAIKESKKKNEFSSDPRLEKEEHHEGEN
ncbi:MAG: signal peptidase II [Candidatus Enteromonas sp.]